MSLISIRKLITIIYVYNLCETGRFYKCEEVLDDIFFCYNNTFCYLSRNRIVEYLSR